MHTHIWDSVFIHVEVRGNPRYYLSSRALLVSFGDRISYRNLELTIRLGWPVSVRDIYLCVSVHVYVGSCV